MATMCIHGCGNQVSPRSQLNECPNCRHALYYWRSKRPAQVLERRRKLELYGSRLDEHFDTKGALKERSRPKLQGNVVHFRSRRRA